MTLFSYLYTFLIRTKPVGISYVKYDNRTKIMHVNVVWLLETIYMANVAPAGHIGIVSYVHLIFSLYDRI